MLTDGPEPITVNPPSRGPCATLLWLARGVALLAASVAVYLLWVWAVAGGNVAGCGDSAESGCGHVLTSRWSQCLHLPIALPGAVVYSLTLVALFWVRDESWLGTTRAWSLLVLLATTLVASACWFMGLQVLVLESICPYCLTAHTCALLLAAFVFWYSPIQWRVPAGGQTGAPPAIRPATALALVLLGLAGTGGLIAGQVLAPPPLPDMRVGTVQLPDGKVVFDVERHPRLGSGQGRYVLVELYDYTCPHCRTTTHYLEQARRRYGDQLVILPLVVPLHPACNPHVRSVSRHGKHACTYARLALAVWHADARQFEAFHLWLMDNADSPAAARRRAEEVVGAAALAKALSDGEVDRHLAENVRLYARSGGGQLPKLLSGTQSAQGRPPSAQQLFRFLEKNVGLRPR